MAEPTLVPSHRKFMSKHLKKLLAPGLGVLLFALLIRLGRDGLQSVIAAANAHFMLLALMVSMPNYPLVSWRWKSITDSIAGRSVANFLAFLRVRVVSATSGLVAPRELAEFGSRTYWLVQFHKLPLATAIQCVLMDRSCDMLISLTALTASLLYWCGVVTSLNGALAVFGFCLASCFMLPSMLNVALVYVLAVLRNLTRAQTGYRKTLPTRMLSFLQILEGVSRPVWRAALLWSFAKFSLMVARNILVARAFDLQLSDSILVVVTPLSQVFFLAALTPGSLGIYEAGWAGILGSYAIEPAKVAAYLIATRLALIFSVTCMIPIFFFPQAVLDRADRTP